MIRIRPYMRLDAPFLLRWAGGRRAHALWCADRFPYPLTAEALESYGDACQADPACVPLTALDQRGEPVGHLCLRRIDFKERSASIGFVILAPEARGRGTGRAFMEAALGYCFSSLGLDRVTLSVFDANPAARRCYLAAGFRDEAHTRGGFACGREDWGRYLMAASRFAFLREREQD